jgi:nucleotide-binding universal stress UspA family protein
MPSRILLAVDGSPKCKEAASSLGSILKTGADCEILLYHCVKRFTNEGVSDVAGFVPECRVPVEEQEKSGQATLEEARRLLVESGFPGERVQTALRLDSEDPAEDIISAAKEAGIDTIALGRRGLGRLERLLLGSVSSTVSQYSGSLNVWVVDAPLHDTRRVLVGIQGLIGGDVLCRYAAETVASFACSQFTFLHLKPPVARYLEEMPMVWEADYEKPLMELMAQGRDALLKRGIPPYFVRTRLEQAREGVARDLLNEIEKEKYQMVVIGKRSLQKKTPFLLGSIANKLLRSVRGVILCMVGAV